MDNVVSARRLRKSLLKKIEYNDNKYLINERRKTDNNISENEKKIDLKNRTLIKIFISIIIIFTCLIGKLCFYEKIKNDNIFNTIKIEYKKNIEKQDVTFTIENLCKKNKKIINIIIPDKLNQYIKYNYFNNIRDRYINFSVINIIKKILNINNTKNISTVTVFNNENTIIEDNDKKDNGIEIELIKKEVNPCSAINSMESDINYIKDKKINIIKPVEGVITSTYGAREEILSGVGSFHTGLDIANKLNTEIKSATDGIVTKVEYNNKYWGNYIIIAIKNVNFKYAHLNEILVHENDSIKQGIIIGKMGSTGYSTGSHLHFEISVDSRTVDPKKFIGE